MCRRRNTFSAPVNQFNTPSTPVTPSFTAVPAAPVDVLFSNAWLDLSKEPLVFTMPNTNGVYNQMTILSGMDERPRGTRKTHHRHRRRQLPHRRSRLEGARFPRA